jgi:hypothetical protein
MNRSSLLPVVVLAGLALAFASPAGAFSGFGVAGALRAPGLAVHVSATTSSRDTCQVGASHDEKAGSASLTGTKRKPGVVACEQPPRSEVTGTALEQQGASALATVG